ncbi:MAG TPA: DDE-type integrase/transposase/recombinase [Oculatellaceae cyanobacterium]
MVTGVNDTWCADLVDMQAFAKQNKNNKYILTIIDVLSRYAWAEPLKDKKPHTVINAFQKVLADSGSPPKKLWVDQGSEFINRQFKKVMAPIVIYHTYGESHAAPVERFNRTLKRRMWCKFTKHSSQEWVSRLPKLISKYNNTVHSSIGMTPLKARKEEPLLLQMQAADEARKGYKAPKLAVGDFVRLAKEKRVFAKSYESQWTDEIFQVTKVMPTKPVTYHIKDKKGEVISGSFYENELQKSSMTW